MIDGEDSTDEAEIFVGGELVTVGKDRSVVAAEAAAAEACGPMLESPEAYSGLS